MTRSRALAAPLTRSLAVIGLTAVVLAAQPPRPRTLRAEVAIAVRGDSATVRARYDFSGNPGALSFELLQQPCALVGPLRVLSAAGDVALARELTQPWLRLHDTSAVDPTRGSLGYTAEYTVHLTAGTVNVPLLLPLAVLRGTSRGDPVAEVRVSAAPETRVLAPRLARTGDSAWSARMVALPAAVRIARSMPNAACADSVPGDSGRFHFIFGALVAVLALWVPTYLWWANRQRQAQ